jgi:hypothetical protein
MLDEIIDDFNSWLQVRDERRYSNHVEDQQISRWCFLKCTSILVSGLVSFAARS